MKAADVFISYEGCGCAGGLVTTIEGESVPRTDTTGNARRKQKAWQDILGRTWKTQTFEWDGSTPYLTTETAFNGRDQAIEIKQTAEDAEATQTTSPADHADFGFGISDFGSWIGDLAAVPHRSAAMAVPRRRPPSYFPGGASPRHMSDCRS